MPLALKQVDKSLDALLTETKFQFYFNEISLADVIHHLQNHPKLLEVWKEYSDDKRTTGGYYYREKYIGSLEHVSFDKKFTSDTEVCAEYILREISFGMKLKYE